jgi:hypothetical protein
MTWYREVVAELRDSWKPSLSWEEVIALRASLQQSVTRLAALRREQRGRVSPTCSQCGGHMVSLITIRSVLFATRRFGLETTERLEILDQKWAEHRAANNLDGCGEPVKVRTQAAHHSHSKRQGRDAVSGRSETVRGPAGG